MNDVPKAIEAVWKIESTWLIALLCHYTLECCMHVRSFCLLTFALPSLAALALPPAVHAASAVHGRRVGFDHARLRGQVGRLHNYWLDHRPW